MSRIKPRERGPSESQPCRTQQHPGPGPSRPDGLHAGGALACAALRARRGPNTHGHSAMRPGSARSSEDACEDPCSLSASVSHTLSLPSSDAGPWRTSQAPPGAPGQPSSRLGQVTGPRHHSDLPIAASTDRSTHRNTSVSSGSRPEFFVGLEREDTPQEGSMRSTQLPTGASEAGVVSPKSLWHLLHPSQGEDRTGRKPARHICALSPRAPGAPGSVPRQHGPAALSSECPHPHQLSAPPSDSQAHPPGEPHRCLSDSLLSDPGAQARSWPPCTPNTWHPQKHNTETPSKGPPQR